MGGLRTIAAGLTLAVLSPNLALAAANNSLYDKALTPALSSDTVSDGLSAQLHLYDEVQPRVVIPAPPRAVATSLSRRRPRSNSTLHDLIHKVAVSYEIDPLLLAAVVSVESGGNNSARSKKGARGLMQVMPQTGLRFGADTDALANPVINLAVGAAYLKTLQARFGNRLPIVLAAYNAGEGAVVRYGEQVPPYAETTNYVRLVLSDYQRARDGVHGR
jgi:soluble lytic murein transglycosylase-like protein